MDLVEKQAEKQSLQKRFPAVDLAYPIALSAYETILKRLDALDNRVQTTMAFAATITLAIPAITTGKGLTFRSHWFVAALVFYGIGNIIGVIARLKGMIVLPSPKEIFENYLDLSEWEFKKDTIFWAGENYRNNNKLLLLRSRLLNVMSLFFGAEVVSLAVWALGI